MEHGVGVVGLGHGFGQAGDGKETEDGGMDGSQVPEPTQLLVEGMLMKLLAQSPDGTLMCCANETHLKFVDSRFLKLYETNTPGAIMAASFHPQKYELFLKIDNRTLIFDLATKEYREPDQSDTMIPPEPWQPPQPPPGAVLGPNMQLGGLGMGGEKRRSGSGRPKGSKDKTQRRPRSAAAQEFEKEVVAQLSAFVGADDPSKWNAKKPAIDALKASPMWDSWSKAGLNEQQLVQFVHRLKARRMGGDEAEVNQMHQPGFLQGMPNVMMTHHIYNQRVGL